MKIVALALVVFLSACGTPSEETPKTATAHEGNAPAESQLLDVAAYKALLAESADYVLIDVRTPGEVAGGRIPGAVNIDYNGATFAADVDKLDHSKQTFVYCAKGGRSGRAASLLLDQGFEHVIDLKGGMTAWTAAGYAVE
jgi:rhodanese-related sulfurtransferase